MFGFKTGVGFGGYGLCFKILEMVTSLICPTNLILSSVDQPILISLFQLKSE